MIDLEAMREKWAEQDEKLDDILRLNRQLLSTSKLDGTRSALQRFIRSLSLETAVWLLIVMALGGFIFDHASALRLSLPAVALDLYAMSMVVATIRQILMARQVDYNQPIAGIQKQLELLRIFRVRSTQWALLAGCVVWAPFAIVMSKLLFGLDVYRVPWLCANLLFGLALIPLTIWLSKTFASRMQASPFVQGLMRDIAGHNLSAAQTLLSALSQFQNETYS